jgi:hypothetical protein
MKPSPTFPSFALLPLLTLIRLVSTQTSPITVPLPNALYTSVYNPSTHLHSWKGIRYATPPTGKLRWQAPKPLDPVINPQTVVASNNGKACPQAMPNIQGLGFIQGDEDCLFLNVWGGRLGGGNGTGGEGGTGRGAGEGKGLPVMVMFHGGGYGLGDGSVDMSSFLEANGGGILGVVVQYRVRVPLLFFPGWLGGKGRSLLTVPSSAHSDSSPPPRSKRKEHSTPVCWIKILRCSGCSSISASLEGIPPG